MTWVSRAGMAYARSYADVFTIGNNIYVLGGNPRETVNGTEISNRAHQMYDTVANTWTAKASVPTDTLMYSNDTYASGWTATVANGCIHTITEETDIFGATFGNHKRYNPANNTWELRARFPVQGQLPKVCEGVGTSFLVTLGSTSYWSNPGDDAACYRYDDAANTWTGIGSQPYIEYGCMPKHTSNQHFWYQDSHNEPDEFYGMKAYKHWYDNSNNTFNSSQQRYARINKKTFWDTLRSKYITWESTYAGGNIYYTSDAELADVAIGGGPKTGGITTEYWMVGKVGENYYLFGGQLGDPAVYYTTHWRWHPNMPQPTGLKPVSGSTINTDIPTIEATIASTGNYAKLRWQLARDAGFTTSLRNLVKDDSASSYKLSGPDTFAIPAGTATELSQGTWHYRARQENGAVEFSPLTTAFTFTVSHPPSASTSSPSGDITLDYLTSGTVEFKWGFSDASPVDFQSAWQIICERNDTGALVFNTGKVASQNARAYTYNFAATEKDVQLRWKIQVWDSDDVTGGYSPYALFRVSDKPTVNVTDPAEGSTTTSSNPTVNWTFTASGGRTQAAWRVVFIQNDAVVHDTGERAGTVKTYTPEAAVLSAGAYTVQVYATDNVGLSNSDSNLFNVNFTPPAEHTTFTLNGSAYEASGYIRITWDNSVRDTAWTSWRIRRRIAGSGVKPQLVYETRIDKTNYVYDDYTAGSNVEYEYFVTQTALRGGVDAESRMTSGKTIYVVSTKYWLIHETDNTKNILLEHVSQEDFADEYESETFTLIGRGRKVDTGTYLGYKGTLTAELRDKQGGRTARQQRMQLEELKQRRETVYLRTPFGDIFKVNLGNIGFARIAGVGMHEALTVSLPYEEIK